MSGVSTPSEGLTSKHLRFPFLLKRRLIYFPGIFVETTNRTQKVDLGKAGEDGTTHGSL